ncbi:MAG: hypothetical protein PHR06_14100 [Candidatus Cloacimonetes bacterium]|nr:hypothetical protein [Candidatus Cloacimonadota bacterium]
MEKDRLNKMCQEVLGKSLDDVLKEFDEKIEKEFDEKIENESPISRSIPVMELKIVYLPGALMVQGRSDNIFGQVFGVEDQMQESFKRCTDMFQEEAVKITEKLGGVKGIKIFTNMNDFKEKP